MKTYLRVNPANNAVLGRVDLADDAQVNTKEAAQENGKPYLIEVTDTFDDITPGETKRGDPQFTIGATSAIAHYPVVALTTDEKAEYEVRTARQLLERTDTRMTRVAEEIYDLAAGNIADLSDAAKALIAQRKAARARLA